MVNRHGEDEATPVSRAALSIEGKYLPLEVEKRGLEERHAPCPAGGELDPNTQANREILSYNIRLEAALLEYNRDTPRVTTHPTNGDEALFQGSASDFQNRFIASYTKGLKLSEDQQLAHLGEVDAPAYCALLTALRTGDCDKFAEVPLGGCDCQDFAQVSQVSVDSCAGGRNLEDPQGGLAFDLNGADSHAVFVARSASGTPIGFPAPPSFLSSEIIGEIAENYWMALLRDVPFDKFSTDQLAADAVADLNRYALFNSPSSGVPSPGPFPPVPTGPVTPDSLLRGNLTGDRVGPYLSQFFIRDVPYGAQMLLNQVLRVLPEVDYMTDEVTWRGVQQGCDFNQKCDEDAGGAPVFDYIRTGRDLGQFAHVDADYYGVYNACLILVSGAAPAPPNPNDPIPPTRRCEATGGLGVPFAPGLPYVNPSADPRKFPPAPGQSRNQIGVNTFGPQHLKSQLLLAMKRALDAVWYQKWNVHRRLRPEVLAGRIHFRLVGAPRANYPFDLGELHKLMTAPGGAPSPGGVQPGSLLQRIFAHNEAQNAAKNAPWDAGTYLLPMAYAEGSPLHPSYGSGHATVAGACVTILKAFFPDLPFSLLGGPMVRDANRKLAPYAGVDAEKITVHGELHKLASNLSLGRNFAGVHYRSDYLASLFLGEAIAISILEDEFGTFNEPFSITFNRFDGTPYHLVKPTCGPKYLES